MISIFTRTTVDFIVSTLVEARDLVVAAKQAEIDGLMKRVAQLEKDWAYERSRADALVDRLLVRDARVAAVAPAAVAAAVEHDLLEGRKRGALQEIFDDVARVGEDPPPAEARAFDFAGGGKGVKGV